MSAFDTFSIEAVGDRAVNQALDLYAFKDAIEFPDRDGTWECCWFGTVVGDRPRKYEFTFQQVAWWKS